MTLTPATNRTSTTEGSRRRTVAGNSAARRDSRGPAPEADRRGTLASGDQLGAALVLLRLLVAVPVGAVSGGWLCRIMAPRGVAAAGMALACVAFVAMTGWGERSLDGAWSTVVLLAAGLGFGLAIAPVNAVLLGGTGSGVHGSASALPVVARTVGMLAGSPCSPRWRCAGSPPRSRRSGPR